MTKEKPKPPEQSFAEQTFDTEHIIRSNLREMDLRVAVSEIIDNALDETSEGEPCVVVVTFDAKSSRNMVTFENRNTWGMDEAKMKEYTRWGGLHQEARKIKEHRLGGKLAALWFSNETDSEVTITSSSQRSMAPFRLKIGNWWKNLGPGVKFPIDRLEEKKELERSGWTRIEIAGTRKETIPSNLAGLAGELGLTFGEKIGKGELKLVLRRVAPRGRNVESVEVLPITIPFSDILKRTKVASLSKSTKLDISWGLIDAEAKKREEDFLKDVYNAEVVSGIRGKSVYYYFGGRLLDVKPLHQVVPGHRDRIILDSFAVKVDIAGWVPKTILKTGLSASDRQTVQINEIVRAAVAKDLKDLVADSPTDDEAIRERYKRVTKEAELALSLVLNERFDGNPQEIADAFHLPFSGRGQIYAKESKSPTKKGQKKIPEKDGLPIRSYETRRRGFVNPIPSFTVIPFENIFPEARLGIDVNGRPVIEINYRNPSILLTLRQKRGKVFVEKLLSIAADVLYHERYIGIYPRDSRAYREAIEEEKANLLSLAQRLNQI